MIHISPEITDYIQLIGGLVILVVAGNYLVDSASDIAKKFHLSSLIIGMTIVAFGTSMPELFVSVQAGLDGHPEMSIGNVLGSNIANIGLILSLTVLIYPIFASQRSIKVDWVFMMIISVLLLLAALDGLFSRIEGCIGVALLTGFTIWSIKNQRKEKGENGEVFESAKKNIWLNLLIFVVAVVALAFGSNQLVAGASGIATQFGVSERVISVVIVGIGTSTPELTASLVAALKKEDGISLGNIIGSNIFNILSVLGLTSIITPIHFSYNEFHSDFIWLLVFSFLLFIGMLNITENRKKYAKSGKLRDLVSTRQGLIGRIWGGFTLALFIYYIVTLFI